MKRIALLGVMLGAALSPGVASADRMSYAFIGINGTVGASVDDRQTTGGGSVDGRGLGFAAGWIMGQTAFVDGRFESHDFDRSIEGYEYNVRLGFRNQFQTVVPWRLDGYGMISLEGRNFERAGATIFDEVGVGFTAGFKASPINEFEFGGELGYNIMGSFDGVTAQAGVQWNITDFFAANVAYRVEDYFGRGPDVDIDGVRLGLRFQFGGG